MDRVGNNFKRNVVKAELWENYGTTSMRGLATLFEPTVLPYSGEGILFAGFALDSSGGEISEHRQVWLARPVSAGPNMDIG